MLVARQQAVAPHRVVGEIFLHVGKAGDGTALGDAFAPAVLGVGQDGAAVAQRRGHLAGFEEGSELGMQLGGAFEGEHRRLATGHDDGVEGGHVQVGHLLGVVHQRPQFRRVDEALADQVGLAVAAGVVGIAHTVGLTSAARGAEDFHLVTRFVKGQVGMRELAPPEAHRPAGRAGNGRVGDDDGHAPPGAWIDDVGVLQAHARLRGAVEWRALSHLLQNE